MEAICKQIQEIASKRNLLICENKSLEYDVEIEKKEINALYGDIDNMKKELLYLEKDLAKHERNKNFNDELQLKNDEITALQSEIKQICKKNNIFHMCRTTLQDEVSHCNSHIKALEKAINSFSNELLHAKSCVEKLCSQNQDQEYSIKEIEHNLEHMKKCLKNLSGELEEKCCEVDFVLQSLQNIDSYVSDMTQRQKELRQVITESQDDYLKLQSKMLQEKSYSEELREKVYDAQENAHAIQDQLHYCEVELDKNRTQRLDFLRAIKDEISRLNRGEECSTSKRSESGIRGKSKQRKHRELINLEHDCENSLKRCAPNPVKNSESCQNKSTDRRNTSGFHTGGNGVQTYQIRISRALHVSKKESKHD